VLSAMCLAGADAFAPACTPGIAMRPGAALCHHRGSSMAGPTLRSPGRKRGLGLRMTSSETETSGQVSGADEAAKAAKMKEVMKIAEQARTALLEAEVAEDQSAFYKGTNVRVSKREELQAKASLGRLAEVTYKSWISAFAGPEDSINLLAEDSEESGATREERRRARVELVFQRLDIDGSGGIDASELEQALVLMGVESSESVIASLFREADINNDKVIDFEEFYRVMSTLILRQEAAYLEKEFSAAEQAKLGKTIVKIPTYDEVISSVSGIELEGGGKNATMALDNLKEEGLVNKWDSASFVMREYSRERMARVTGIEEPEETLGMQPKGLVFKRIQIVQFAGITALMTFLFGGLFPEPIRPYLSSYGQIAFAVNLILPFFSVQIDKALLDYEFDQEPTSADRWVTREAGKFLTAYLCGIPVEKIEYEDERRPTVLTYSKSSGNIDFGEIRQNTTANMFDLALAFGLTPKEVQKQAMIYTAGLMAEYERFGSATMGYMLLAEMDKQLQYAQTMVDPFYKAQLARFGIIESRSIVKGNGALLEQLASEIKAKASVERLIALIESNSIESTDPDPQQIEEGVAAQ